MSFLPRVSPIVHQYSVLSEENQSHWPTSTPNGNITPGYFEGKFHVHDNSSSNAPSQRSLPGWYTPHCAMNSNDQPAVIGTGLYYMAHACLNLGSLGTCI